jgi:thiol:disulfide interchange protein DsbD
MNEFVLIQADITDNQEKQKDLSSKYGVFGPPAIIFFDENGEVMKSKSLVGFIKPADFLKHLNQMDAI